MYTAEEVQAAVEKLVRGSIRRPIDTLGVRRIDVAFSDVQEAGATVLLLNNAGPFYCLALGAQRLKDAIAAESGVLDQLLDAVAATGRRVLPIESVDMLFGAKAALEELESAAASRTQGFKDIAKVPSYQRFAANVQTYLDGPAQNIKSNGAIVQTPEQAKQAIPTLLRQLLEQHESLTNRAAQLAQGIEDFKAVNLPALVASGAISRAREVLGQHADELEALSKDDRLLKVRDVTLDVLAAKAVVTQFGSFSGPTTYYPIVGTGSPYADSNRPATPASIESTTMDAVAIFAGANRLEVTADGASISQTLDLTPSTGASTSGTASEGTSGGSNGWLIGDGTDPTPPVGATTPNNNVLRFKVGSTVYEAFLTLSPDYTTFRSAQEICDDVSAQVPGNILVATPVFVPLEYSGPLNIDAGGLTTTFHVPAGASDLIALGVKVGHLVKVKNGANAGLYEITSVATTTFVASRPSGTFAAQTGANCEVGPQYRRIRIALSDLPTQIPIQETLTILADTEASANACNTFGFFPGITIQCLLTTMDQVVDNVNGLTNKFVASTAYLPVVSSAGRSDILNSSTVVLAKLSGTAAALWSGPFLNLVGTFDYAKIVEGDTVALRSGPDPNVFGIVDEIQEELGTIRVLVGAPGTNAVSVTYEIGTPFTATEYMSVRIDAGPNRGDYLVQGPGSTPLDVIVKGILPQTRQGIDPITFTASIGHKALVLKGKSTGLSAELSVEGTLASTFFTTVPAIAYGTTPYFQLPQMPRGLQAGDVLELYNDQYNVPTTTHVVDLVDASVRVIRVTPELSTHLPTPPPERWVFADQVPPFARVRITQTYDFSTFQGRLEAWLAREENQAQYFSDVNRRLNPILVNSNVTAQQVQDAKNIVLPIYQALSSTVATNTGADPTLTLEYAIGQYQVTPVAAVDTLLRSYKEKGSDRAVDLLLQGLFQTFFGLTLDEASYAGSMQAAMREVAREDLAVRRVERSEAREGPRQISRADSPDYDYDSSDIEHGAEVDPPEA